MRIKWTLNEARFLPRVGKVSPNDEREVPDTLGAALIKQGHAVEVKAKAAPTEKITDKEDNQS